MFVERQDQADQNQIGDYRKCIRHMWTEGPSPSPGEEVRHKPPQNTSARVLASSLHPLQPRPLRLCLSLPVLQAGGVIKGGMQHLPLKFDFANEVDQIKKKTWESDMNLEQRNKTNNSLIFHSTNPIALYKQSN